MRAFIVLCLVAVACADKLGYNYQPVAHSSSGLSFAPGSGSGSGSISLGGPSGLGSSGLGSSGLGSSGLGSAGISGPVNYDAPAATGELEKEFYTFSANEEDFDEPQALERVASSVNKGLRVVFIKGPENRGLENAALALAKQAAQQETAIYVLNKHTDIGDLANKLNAIRSNTNNKPEVHFVKYRTPEDAANAQRAIQSQYDQLGGSSQAINGGVANALNFASASQVRQPNARIPENSYLPSSVIRRLRFRR
ncbi:uncharacterized protein Dana_GF16445, isoform B [Drosophila ananassae]|uniref:Uncharacterized protein, isoform B n=1 Tax=Drosophila ananassae TaxID=7217 RepID=A0A0P9A0W4_DROAN|nr:uncharacterized protein Dana_GF16445, isoform B [Drosophila ananassae]